MPPLGWHHMANQCFSSTSQWYFQGGGKYDVGRMEQKDSEGKLIAGP